MKARWWFCIKSTIMSQLPVTRRLPLVSQLHSDAHQIYSAAIQAVSPFNLVQKALNFDPNTNLLRVGDTSYLLNKNVKLLAFGKAVLGMVAAVERTLGDHLLEGVASIPVGTIETAKRMFPHQLLLENSRIRVYEGAVNNLPDDTAESAARHVLSIAEAAGDEDIVMVVMSGGGSALLPCPVEGISLHEKRQAINSLARSGATINELNAFRKSISCTKGGRLAEVAFPAKVVGFILSDVIGDPLDVIASGPTVPSSVSNSQVLHILEKYNLLEELPPSIGLFLGQTETKSRGSAPVINGQYSHVQNLIVGSNRVATSAACQRARQLDRGYDCHVWSHRIQGEARLLGQAYAQLAHSILLQWSSHDHLVSEKEEQLFFEEERFQEIFRLFPELKEDFAAVLKMTSLSQQHPNHPAICLISSGEPTVTVKGNGKGGRNQELALAFSIELQQQLLETHLQLSMKPSGDHKEESCSLSCLFLSVGTDGQDGPCDSAGAVVDMETIAAANEQGIDPMKHLDDNNSYHFFSSVSGGRYMIKTGLTGTNVMDLQILIIHFG